MLSGLCDFATVVIYKRVVNAVALKFVGDSHVSEAGEALRLKFAEQQICASARYRDTAPMMRG
jgi:hypothetical protein